jgi:hypothetical protein
MGDPLPASAMNLRKVEEEHNAFIRWQEVSRAQLGYTINLVLTLTTATAGFAVNLVANGKTVPDSIDRYALGYSLSALMAAVAIGLGANYSRLWDFRWTTRAARGREMQVRIELNEDPTPKQKARARDREKYSNWAETLGKVTWWLLLFQLLAFFVGVIFLAWSVRHNYWRG